MSASSWHRLKISQIEDLSDAVHGAGMEATQMSTGGLSGSLVFSEANGVTYSSGLINGRVALNGPLSPTILTVGVVLHLDGICRHWLEEVNYGAVGVFHGGDEHDSYYTPGALYATATISSDRLEEEAAKHDLLLDQAVLGGTRVHGRSMAPGVLMQLERLFARIHKGEQPRANAAAMLLDALIDHFGRPPFDGMTASKIHLHARIVRRARAFIMENLAEPISLEVIATAAFTSRRSLFRAFADVFDETPQTYVRRLRLNRIRQGLANDTERACTIALVANQWGVSELGRLSGWYRELFGELPSDTVASSRRIGPDGKHRTVQ